MSNPQDTSVKLSDFPEDFPTEPDEMPPAQKAQFQMTYWVLAGASILLMASGLMYVYADNGINGYITELRGICADLPDTSTDELKAFCSKHLKENYSTSSTAAKEFFEFCKNFIPPIVTLVLGAHYVTKKNAGE